MDPRVEAIRKNQTVGAGSCSSTDECWTDAELIADLDRDRVKTPDDAVQWAIGFEQLRREVDADYKAAWEWMWGWLT